MARREKVTRVIDGDTFRTKGRKHSVRLANIYAPEKGRPGAAAATKRLKSLIGGEMVSIETVARDAYGRAVANVKVDGTSVNKTLQPKKRK